MKRGDGVEATKYIFALGFFDGVHLGHQALLKVCCHLAAELEAVPGAITFDNHPKALILNPPPVLLSTEEDRRALLAQYGIEKVYTFPVVPEVMGQHWEKFVVKLLELGAVGFVCGDDFRFGYRGLGSAESLEAYCRQRNLPCTVVPEQTLKGNRISSTLIRRCMEAGDLAGANTYLGHPYRLTAKIDAAGSLVLPERIARPKPGTYDCRAQINGRSVPAVVRLTAVGGAVQLPENEKIPEGYLPLEFNATMDEEC